MIFYMFYSITRLSINSSRMFDIMDILLTFSYLLMLFGVTLAIKTSVDKMTRESRIQSEIDLFEQQVGEILTDNSDVYNQPIISDDEQALITLGKKI